MMFEDMDKMQADVQRLKSKYEFAKGLKGAYLHEGESRSMQTAAVRWTFHDILHYVVDIGVTDAEAGKKIVALLSELADLCVEHMEVKDNTRLPAIDYFRALVPCKDPSSRD